MRATGRNAAPLLARIKARPDPASWREDELLTLTEAAALFWPDGPLSAKSLRTARVEGVLKTVKIAGKIFTTPAGISRMCRGEATES